ncbi:MAG: MarR family transcriptional regulator [Actinomycetota bacterium]
MERTATRQPTRIELEPWVRFLRAHAAIVKELSSELVAAHGLTINDYEVLLRLSRADGSRMRRVDLAQEVLLTPSGITRLLEGLEGAGYVERVACKEDLRVSYAQLTAAGRAKLRAAGKTHVTGIDRLFLDRFDGDERAVLSELLGRLTEDEDGEACAPE